MLDYVRGYNVDLMQKCKSGAKALRICKAFKTGENVDSLYLINEDILVANFTYHIYVYIFILLFVWTCQMNVA